MTLLYIIGAAITVWFLDKGAAVTAEVNDGLGTDMSGMAIYLVGLLIAFVLDAISS